MTVKANVAHLRYTLEHKWYVFLACSKSGVPLWQSLMHDWSKFTPWEWGGYVRLFFDPNGNRLPVHKHGAYDPNAQPQDFKLAWMYHQREKHHWQSWVTLGNGGVPEALPIPDVYLREMIADWLGAGLAKSGVSDPPGWYARHKDDLFLHPDSRVRLEELLDLFGKTGVYDAKHYRR